MFYNIAIATQIRTEGYFVKLLLLADMETDFGIVLESCDAEISRISLKDAFDICFDVYDA